MTAQLHNQSSGWSWKSFLLGPFWYVGNGMVSKGLVLLLIAIITLGFGIPIIWFYCGLKGKSDLHEKQIKERSQFSPNKI
jgi:hypothetical protein